MPGPNMGIVSPIHGLFVARPAPGPAISMVPSQFAGFLTFLSWARWVGVARMCLDVEVEGVLGGFLRGEAKVVDDLVDDLVDLDLDLESDLEDEVSPMPSLARKLDTLFGMLVR